MIFILKRYENHVIFKPNCQTPEGIFKRESR